MSLPSWRLAIDGIDEPIVVLDPDVIRTRTWSPATPPSVSRVLAGVGAALGGDGETLVYTFVGEVPEHADYPTAEVIETRTAVVVVPTAISGLPPDQPRRLPAAEREVTVTLARPLGRRVLVDVSSRPVQVTGL